MKKWGVLDWIALVLVLIGAINWGLIGFFSFDLIGAIFGNMSALSRVIYALVGIAAVFIVITANRYLQKEER
jgi:uncharacterized membrane protein YuzA (DUF378 family)